MKTGVRATCNSSQYDHWACLLRHEADIVLGQAACQLCLNLVIAGNYTFHRVSSTVIWCCTLGCGLLPCVERSTLIFFLEWSEVDLTWSDKPVEREEEGVAQTPNLTVKNPRQQAWGWEKVWRFMMHWQVCKQFCKRLHILPDVSPWHRYLNNRLTALWWVEGLSY